mmetsp:Transcript_43394/g.136836  ORF Transcript_43394/g.136836 Transcript_43394/m.136836 type:complete len:244 (+) Transcript_43394:411-1142(+)
MLELSGPEALPVICAAMKKPNQDEKYPLFIPVKGESLRKVRTPAVAAQSSTRIGMNVWMADSFMSAKMIRMVMRMVAAAEAMPKMAMSSVAVPLGPATSSFGSTCLMVAMSSMTAAKKRPVARPLSDLASPMLMVSERRRSDARKPVHTEKYPLPAGTAGVPSGAKGDLKVQTPAPTPHQRTKKIETAPRTETSVDLMESIFLSDMSGVKRVMRSAMRPMPRPTAPTETAYLRYLSQWVDGYS